MLKPQEKFGINFQPKSPSPQTPEHPNLKPKEKKINKISGNCQEKLKFFEHKETSSLAAPLTKPTPATKTARKAEIKSKTTPDFNQETIEKIPEVTNLYQNTYLKTIETKIEIFLKPEVMNPARPPTQSNFLEH